jgi:type II secretion system protein C
MLRGTYIQASLRLVPWIAGAAVLAACAFYAVSAIRLPSVPDEQVAPPRSPEWQELPSMDTSSWDVFTPGQPRMPASGGPLNRRFRLAGTFFSFGDKRNGVSEESVCKAILDDLDKKTQHLLAEGESFEGIQVAQIYRDHVLLRSDGREEELWLSFSMAGEKGDGKDAGDKELQVAIQPLETSRFGTRVGEHRWVLNKDSLMAYYEEIREDPERIGHLFVSLRPDYQDNAIAGYQLNMTGEQEFFKAAGLIEGDVVRKVNSLNMTSQARAEYFIGEFLQGRLNAVVLDIEREGAPQKLIYLIR